MPTSTIIILAVLALLLPWTIYHLVRDMIRQLSKGADIRGKDNEIRDTIEAEREKDRQRMGSMFAASAFRSKKSGDDR